jgi:hypothetical protein
MPRSRTAQLLFAVTAVWILATAGCTGGGETVISGIGNGGNVIGTSTADQLAEELAESPAIPPVSDDDLLAAWNAIRDKARTGDPDATLVVLRVAAEQREEREE